MLISYLCYKTTHNCEYHDSQHPIPLQVQWLRTISDVIFSAFVYSWYFAIILLLFRPFQLRGVKRKLILACCFFYRLEALNAVALPALTGSNSHFSFASDKGPSNTPFLISECLQTFFYIETLLFKLKKTDADFVFPNDSSRLFIFYRRKPGCLFFCTQYITNKVKKAG